MINDLQLHVKRYLEFCDSQKRLDTKTLKVYRIDLTQFVNDISEINIPDITSNILERYITGLHNRYKPKTVKRKIATTKAFFHYLEQKEIINQNPYNKVQIHFREPNILPRTIPLNTVEKLLSGIYSQLNNCKTEYQKKYLLRDVAVIELLFSTGMRISELCELSDSNINLYDGTVLIYGKGDKERLIHIGNESVINVIKRYRDCFYFEIEKTKHFFINNLSERLSDQSVRRMINKYTLLSKINLHITICLDILLLQVYWKQMLTYDIFRKC